MNLFFATETCLCLFRRCLTVAWRNELLSHPDLKVKSKILCCFLQWKSLTFHLRLFWGYHFPKLQKCFNTVKCCLYFGIMFSISIILPISNHRKIHLGLLFLIICLNSYLGQISAFSAKYPPISTSLVTINSFNFVNS